MAIEDSQTSSLYSFSSWMTSLLPSARAEEAKNDNDDDASASNDTAQGKAVAAPTSDSKGEDSKEDDAETDAGGEEEESSGGADEEEEEEEEEPEDEYPAIREKCADSKECANLKHHFDHCQERVEAGKGHKGEDCVEELFHLMHCVDNCAAPKIFAKLR